LSDAQDLRFAFGANWAAYIKTHFSEERVEIAQRHLLDVLKLRDLKGKTFLDIGCGSGLHSLAALRAGADRAISFDFDADSVATAMRLRELSDTHERWLIMQGSVLDDAFVGSLPSCDVVYSWGVLHHTGNMWKAIENAARPLHESSVFYIALYSSDACTDPPAAHWLKVKREYNRASLPKKRWMEWHYAWNASIKRDLLKGRNPQAYIREYKQKRGMSFWHDVRDWLGGYPMEYAGHKEAERFCKERLGLELLWVRAGGANTEYIFRPAGSHNYWDEVLARSSVIDLPGPFVTSGGFAWRAAFRGDICEMGDPERLMLYEDGCPVGWPDQNLDMIAAWGRGRYRLEEGGVVLSAGDNSDPNKSGHRYQFRANFA
jgi:predicted RNA methylase